MHCVIIHSFIFLLLCSVAVSSSFLPGYPRVQPGSLGSASFTLRIAATGAGNCSCAAFQQHSNSLLFPTSDSITGNLTAAAVDEPVPLDPTWTDPVRPGLVARFAVVEILAETVEFNLSVQLPRTELRGSEPFAVYCALFPGPLCNGANSTTCSSVLSKPVLIMLADSALLWKLAECGVV